MITTDFRSVYATLLEDWLGVEPARVLPKVPGPATCRSCAQRELTLPRVTAALTSYLDRLRGCAGSTRPPAPLKGSMPARR